MNCLLKSFILKQLNKVIDDHKTSLAEVRQNVQTWNGRAQKISAVLASLLSKLEDDKITDEELEAAVSEIENLVKGW